MTVKRVGQIVAASPPLLVALLIAKLWLSGTLGYYIAGRTIWIVLVGGALFAVVGVTALWTALRDSDVDTHLSWRTVVFLAPVLAGLLLPPRPLSASSGQSSSLGALQLTAHVSAGTPGDAFGYWVGALSAHSDGAWWAGKHVTLVGFVAHQTGLPPRSFIVGRYLVTCCVVDATLLGFPVQIARGTVPREGAWVQVTGVFGRHYWVDPGGQQYPLIERGQIAPVSIPSSPYLSP